MSGQNSRFPMGLAGLFLLVLALLLAPVGALIGDAIARTTGGNLPPRVLIGPDPVSDGVAATAAEFRVDESGAATYSIPLLSVPGTAGVTPQLSLSYSSLGSYGPLGKGWSIGGLSSISRCRATREAGDFIGAATPDGTPAPINFTGSDRFCLDGQRLVPAPATCPAGGGLAASAWATEIDSFQRVCAYSSDSRGPLFFTVQRKDGSTSWYGDRDNNASANRGDGYFETSSALNPGAALTWAQTRFQDSTGNYIDYHYLENPAGAGTGEHLISEIRYTGKVVLPGQSGSASAPYARVVFNYDARPTWQWSRAYASGGTLTQSRVLSSITSCASIGCATADQARHYLLTYAPSASGSTLDTLVGFQECRDTTGAVCASPTAFAWTQGRHEFATYEKPANLGIATDHFRNFKLGDINGDGRQDFVFLHLGGTGCVGGSWIVSMLGTSDSSGRPTFGSATFNCVPASIVDRGDGAWHLFDYTGDGRDDLFVSSHTGQGWRVHPSNGVHFDMTTNLIAGLWPAIPSVVAETSQVQLADFNGDGLTDIIYPSGGGLRARLMERQPGGFGWGAERAVGVNEHSLPIGHGCEDEFNPDVRHCERVISGMPSTKTGFMQMVDFNGDAASDLAIRITTQAEYWANYPGCQREILAQSTGSAGGTIVRYKDPSEPTALAASANNCWVTERTDYLYALVITDQTPTALTLANHAVLATGTPHAIVFADINGDGLSDYFLRSTSSSEWRYALNTGRGFQPGQTLPVQGFRDHVRFADVNGDGRADMLYPFNGGSYKAYNVRYALPAGGFGPASWLPGVPGRHGNALLCEGSGCDVNQRVPLFVDLDGDGNLDFLSLSVASSTLGLYASRSNQRYSPRDVITSIVNGLGAETHITYAPLTNKDLYRRDSGSRNGQNWGRGSPVMDLLTPSYVVARVSSSSPQAGAPDAKATVHYRYAGARVQAGGRGFLGFRTIETIDPNQSGGYVVTLTAYAQNFPFVGMPMQTVKSAVLNQTYMVPTCLSGIISNACFSTPGEGFASLGGSVFSNSVHSWEVAPASLALQAPVHVRTQGTEESLRDPYTGVQTSKVSTAFGYGSHGNVTQTVVDTFDGAAASPSSTVITANSYGDDIGRWRLGRLTASTVTHQRPGEADVVRTTGFTYDMGGAATGLLTEERTQPGGTTDQALTNSQALDHYGNRVQSVTCAAPSTSCGLAGFQFHPADRQTVKRYSRIEYDARGRFPIATIEPFWTETGGEERTTARVIERNVFGDAVNVLDVNNVRTFAVKGTLGRDYYAWTQTDPYASPGHGGLSSRTTYRWCGQVECPTGARFRQQVVTAGAPRQWSYFDVLGRPMMKAAESFNAGVIDADVSAVCTDFDATGKPRRSSTPFFLPGTAGPDGPGEVQGVCASPARQWAVTTFDVLGRPVRTVAPDSSQVSTTHAGLSTTAVDQRGNATTQTRNGRGELVAVTDAAGLATSYSYTADGNLRSVSRNAGAGLITNAFVYDGLGRKIRQTDPDTGTTHFEYNALGEVIAQADASGQRTEHELDARGRVWRQTVKLASGMVESQSTFTFDAATNGSGALQAEAIIGLYGGAGAAGTELSFTRQHYYDALGRPQSGATVIDGQWYTGQIAYDTLGRPWKSQDASGQWTKTQYGPRGVVAVCASDWGDTNPACGVGSDTYQRVLATDAWGNVVKERRGDSAAMEVTRRYSDQTGRLASICAGTAACNLTNEAYGWDGAGNLTSHQKDQRYLEGFAYDSLNRLTEARVLMHNGSSANQVTLAQDYDGLGNVCSRNGLDYAYPGAAGCGATASAAFSSSAPMSAAAASAEGRSIPTTPFYLRPATTQRLRPPTAWSERSVRHAPETPTRRYSERSASDDEPRWERYGATRELSDRSALPSDPSSRVRNGSAPVSPGESLPPNRSWLGGPADPQVEPFSLRGKVPTPRTTAGSARGMGVRAVGGSTTNANPAAATIQSTGSSSPHAVARTGSGASATFYHYDIRGNQTFRDAPGTANDRTIAYSVDDKAYEIATGSGQRVRFWYGPDGQRYKRVEGGKTTLFLGGVEVVIQGGVSTFKRTLGGIAIQSVTHGGVAAMKYLFHDHLGSLVRIANADGSLAEALDYAAFGERRSNTSPYDAGSGSPTTDRGFTGHEMIDGTGVIHMNGRIYDAALGRFLQADPVIQAPDNAQSWNAYTYVFNNPLAYTDPSGNISLRQGLAMVIGVVAAVLQQYYISHAMWGAAFGVAVAGGFAAGYVATGTLRGGLNGAFTAGLTFGVAWASHTYNWGATATMVAQAVSGGIVESLQGGNFGSGFAAAGLTAAFMPHAGSRNATIGSIKGALIGGTISELTGGKFANGASSGAIQGALAGQAASQDGEWTAEDSTARDAAMNVYGDNSGGMLGEMGVGYAPTDGFAASLTRPDANGPYYLSYRGSERAWNNWRNNFDQALGRHTSQYDQAIALSSQVWKATGGNVVFVGHSLGGGLASAGAHATGGRAITFNAAGLGSQYRMGAPTGIRAHYIRGEILTTFQRWTPFPNAVGMPIPHPGRGNPFSRHAIGQFP